MSCTHCFLRPVAMSGSATANNSLPVVPRLQSLWSLLRLIQKSMTLESETDLGTFAGELCVRFEFGDLAQRFDVSFHQSVHFLT